MKTLYAAYTGQHWQINYAEGFVSGKLPGKQNSFMNKTDAENCIRAMVKSNPKVYRFNETQ